MTPAEAIRTHGALGAAHADLHATRAELADAIASLVASVLATVAVAQERDRLRARLAAVRTLLSGAESEGQHHVTTESVRAALGSEPPGSPDVPPVHLAGSTSRHSAASDPQGPVKTHVSHDPTQSGDTP